MAADPTAAQLAREARKAQNAGLIVRAYMLYAEAVRLDPNNVSYLTNREALAPLAHMMAQAGFQSEQKNVDELLPAAANQPPSSTYCNIRYWVKPSKSASCAPRPS